MNKPGGTFVAPGLCLSEILSVNSCMNHSCIKSVDTQFCQYYFYDDPNNANRLLTVADASGNNGVGFKNLTGNTTGTYSYDANGNLSTDPYKGITTNYNYLNRANQVTITTANGRYINYVYTASGQLLRKEQYDNGNLITFTDYIDGFVYINNGLDHFPMPEGRVRVARNSGTCTYEYVITDQQGNARISFGDDGTGKAVVTQENSYYAFGLIMPNSPVATPSSPNKNLYNGGSEWQNDYGDLPDLYETFYRNYDAALGRWTGVDPMAEATESMTSYQYAGNNPVMMNDPMGNLFTPSLHGQAWIDQQEALAMSPEYQQYESDLAGDNGAEAQGLAKAAFTTASQTSGATSLAYASQLDAAGQPFLSMGGFNFDFEVRNGKLQGFYQKSGSFDYTIDKQGEATSVSSTDVVGAWFNIDANQGGDPPTYRLQHIIKDGIEQDNTPFLILFPVLKGIKTVWNLLSLVKEDPEAELQSIRELKNFKYDPRLENQTDLYHDFPRSFDKTIIDNAPWAQRVKDGANWFEYPGWVNDKPGNFQIGINDQGVIFHRNFVPLP